MRRDTTFDDSVANTPFDTLIEALMATMLLFLPFAFGGIEAWGQAIWFVLVAALGGCLLLKNVVYHGCGFVWSWAYVPIVLFLLLIVLQQTPLPGGWIEFISPATTALRREFLGELAPTGRTTLSLYAFATAVETRMVLSVVVIFVVVLNVYRAPARLRRLLMTVMFAGLAVALLAAYQDVTKAELIYGLVPVGHKNAGPFLNYSHFSQFMNLSVGAAIALLLLTASEWADGEFDRQVFADELRRPHNAFVWPALALCVLGPVLVFWSMSRMGMISMLCAAGVTAGVFGWRSSQGSRRGRSGHKPGGAFLMLGLAVAVLALLLVIGFEVTYDRLATLRNVETASGGRGQIVQGILSLARRFPVFGTGLGTHSFVFPMVDTRDSPTLATHAENEYAQLLEECGGVGLLLAAVFLAFVGVAYGRAVWKPRRPEQFAAFGLGFGLLAVLIHSASDFGQHMPANATLTAVFTALLINIGGRPDSSRARRPETSDWPALLVRGGALAGFVVGASWVVYEGDVARRADVVRRQAQTAAAELETAGWQGTDDQYRDLLSAAETTTRLQPANVVDGHWLNAYRWQAISRDVTDPDTRRLAFTEESLGFARQLVQAFDAVRPLCPTFGPPLCVAGQIRSLVLNDSAGDTQIRQAFRLTPYDRTVCYINGLLAVERQDWDTARVALDRYVLLGGPRWQLVDVYLLARRPDLAYEAARGDRANLQRLADGLTAGWPHEAALAARCRTDVERLLISESEADGAGADLWVGRANYERANGRPAEAVSWQQKAVESDYGRIDWRMDLARMLAEIGNRDEALRHVRICLRLRPKMPEAESLLAAYSSGRAAPAGVR
ncbi:MAG TPA: O-antigen ligase family protein [Tepidisphaeraceae bacterium]|jgi:tetratricopeptide (TPR) repeat protein